jgi:hypothetical protein
MSDSLRFRWALAGLLAAVGPTAAVAQNTSDDNTRYGTTAAEFLLLGASARGAALGTPFAAIVNDVSALYYNPAGIALQRTSEFQVSAYDYVANTDYAWGGLSFPFDGRSKAVGFQVGTFGFGDQPVYTVDQPEGTGAVYSVSETFAGITYAQNFSDRFSAGLTAKFIFDNLGGAKGNAFAVDFGTNFHSRLGGKPIQFSFTLQNLGTDLSYSGEPLFVDVPRDSVPGVPPTPSVPQPGELRTKSFNLPTVFRVALGYDFISSADTRWTLMADFNQQTSNKASFGVGTELDFRNLGESGFGAVVRGSYSYQPANNFAPGTIDTALEDEGDLQGLAFGGGLYYRTPGKFSIGLDYAYRYMGVLGPTNFFTVALGF